MRLSGRVLTSGPRGFAPVLPDPSTYPAVVRFREPMPLLEAYSAAWSDRAGLGSESIEILYIEMHRSELDAFLTVSNPILDFVEEAWEAGSPPDQFEREFSRRWWMLFGRSLTRAVGANVNAVRAVLKNFG